MTTAGKATIELVAWLRAELDAGLERERKLATEIDQLREDLRKAVALLNGAIAELPLNCQETRWVGKIKL